MSPDTGPGTARFMRAFTDREAVARYLDGPPRLVPGLEALHRMTGILLAEHAGPQARILVLGAGGGLELRAMADAHPGWTFVGVDPSAGMLGLARTVVGPHADRVAWVEGTIDDAPAGPFDGATCLLTLHFLAESERVRTVAAIHGRLRPGAAFVAAHGSLPREAQPRRRWLSRYAAYAVGSGIDVEQAQKARDAVDRGVHMLSPEQDEAILRRAGFAEVELFYAAFTWRGWVAHA